MFRLISASGLFATVAAATALGATGALATTVEVVQAEVSVNRGDGYKPLAGKTTVYAGHLVMAAPNGSAKVIYDDGCVVEVAPGAVVAVYETSPCQAQTAAVDTSAQTGAANPRRGYIIAGVVVAGIAGGIVALSSAGGDDEDDDGLKKALNDDDDDDDDDDEGSSP
jgi:hypothetical protein